MMRDALVALDSVALPAVMPILPSTAHVAASKVVVALVVPIVAGTCIVASVPQRRKFAMVGDVVARYCSRARTIADAMVFGTASTLIVSISIRGIDIDTTSVFARRVVDEPRSFPSDAFADPLGPTRAGVPSGAGRHRLLELASSASRSLYRLRSLVLDPSPLFVREGSERIAGVRSGHGFVLGRVAGSSSRCFVQLRVRSTSRRIQCHGGFRHGGR